MAIRKQTAAGEKRARSRRLILLAALIPVLLLSGCITSNVGEPSVTNVPAASGNVAIFTPDPAATYDFTPVTPAGTSGTDATSQPVVTDKPPQPTQTVSKGPLSGLIICVDAGHQDTGLTEKEPCAPWGPEANSKVNNTTMKAKATSGTSGVSTKKTEYAVNLEIALKLRDALEAQGATVVMSRTDNSSRISNRERALLANEANCVLTFNIHCNGSDNSSVSGVEIYVRGVGDNTSEYAERSKNEAALGQKLLDRIVAATGAKKRSVNKSDSYTGINWRDHATFIIECGFMSNPEEDVNLSTPDYQQRFVSGIVKFVMDDYLNG